MAENKVSVPASNAYWILYFRQIRSISLRILRLAECTLLMSYPTLSFIALTLLLPFCALFMSSTMLFTISFTVSLTLFSDQGNVAKGPN